MIQSVSQIKINELFFHLNWMLWAGVGYRKLLITFIDYELADVLFLFIFFLSEAIFNKTKREKGS